MLHELNEIHQSSGGNGSWVGIILASLTGVLMYISETATPPAQTFAWICTGVAALTTAAYYVYRMIKNK